MSAPGITEPTEAITRAKAGDAEAWGQLYHDYAPAIFRFCRRAEERAVPPIAAKFSGEGHFW